MNKTILCLAVACALWAEVPGVIAIRNARIVPAAGPEVPSGTVVVRDGLIESVGANVTIPADAWVVDGSSLTVYPGLIDALSTWGIAAGAPAASGRSSTGPPETPAPAPAPSPSPGPRPGQTPSPGPSGTPARGPEDRPSNTSWVHAQDLIQLSDRNIAAARNAGFTTAVTYPTSGIFAGQGAVVNLAGDKPGKMVLAAPAGMYLSLSSPSRGSSGFPGSLMGVIAYIRQVYLDADHYQAAKAAYAANPRGMRRPDYDRALEGVLEAPRVLLPAGRGVEIDRMIRFSAELKRPAILYGGHEAYAAAELLRKSGLPMLISLRWPERARDADPDMKETLRVLEMREKAPSSAAALAKAGVRFAFYSGGVERPAELRRAVKRAIEAGLSQQDAVRALTLSAAEIYGLDDRLGSIEPGKIANLVVTDGNLFDDGAKIKYVFIDGVKYEPTAEPQAESAPREATQQ